MGEGPGEQRGAVPPPGLAVRTFCIFVSMWQCDIHRAPRHTRKAGLVSNIANKQAVLRHTNGRNRSALGEAEAWAIHLGLAVPAMLA